MKATILSRLKRLKEVQAIENLPPVEFQTGYLKSLPAEYTGERHIVTVGRKFGRALSVGGAAWSGARRRQA
jgi:hypothetical protein